MDENDGGEGTLTSPGVRSGVCTFQEEAFEVEENEDYRALVYGSSKFLVSLGLTCKMTLNTIIAALYFFHRTFRLFHPARIERKFLCAACLCIAWKIWEDREGLKSGSKVKDLSIGVLLLSSDSRGIDAVDDETLAAEWVGRDGGAELQRVKEAVKLYELVIIRALSFNIEAKESEMVTGLIAMYIGKLVPHVEEHIETFDKLYDLALGVVVDFLLWPLCLKYSIHNIVAAAVFKSTIAFCIPFVTTKDGSDDDDHHHLSPAHLTHSQLSIIESCPETFGALMEDLRLIYGWVRDLETRIPLSGQNDGQTTIEDSSAATVVSHVGDDGQNVS